jgi:hypothetical protein
VTKSTTSSVRTRLSGRSRPPKPPGRKIAQIDGHLLEPEHRFVTQVVLALVLPGLRPRRLYLGVIPRSLWRRPPWLHSHAMR